MSNFILTPEQIERNFTALVEYASSVFKNRKDELLVMYESLELKIAVSPASSTEYYHNAFPGGFLDHSLRVLEYSFVVYDTWKNLGIDVSTFTTDELAFVALHHDFGKLGFPGDDNDRYIPTDDSYSNKRGVYYEMNPKIPYSTIPHLTLYLMQHYNIKLSWNEYQSILLQEGLYEYGNKSYFVSYNHSSKLRCVLPHIIHQAKLIASQFEYERWANGTGERLKNYME